ncbi:AI-2E family transporter [Thermaurantiacus tibetensis]|uniref:AI-2E family transporter n=1 Tax=Thermaurantiacus tibetensis TaxID=2759035 RepID=UPI00188E7047|nr:AI-2E family transporter [Thermaurantiacus tibetensis]
MNEALRPPPIVERPARAGEATRVFRNGLLFMAAVGTAVLLWQLSQLLLVAFACGVVAMMVSELAASLKRGLGLPFWLAFTLAVVVPIAFIVGAFSLFGAAMADQFAILLKSLPGALAAAQEMLMASEAGRRVLAEVPGLVPSGARVFELVQSVLSNVGTVLSMVAIILVGGIYLAAQPRLYTRSALALVPPASRLAFARTFRRVVGALQAWLRAQGVGMAFVGVATGAGLSAVGIPGAPAIGLVAGLCEFVPYLGTFVVAIPSILIGFSISVETGIWTIIVIVAVQQIQGNLVSPMAQSRLADLPPALTIFSLVTFGLLMGPLGVILAVPLTVVGVALLRELVIVRRRPPPREAA